MIFEFDRDFAKEAQETGLGRIITRKNREVIIVDWNCDVKDRINYNIWGYFLDSEVGFYWTKDGKLVLTGEIIVNSEYDLLIEVFDDNTINSNITIKYYDI